MLKKTQHCFPPLSETLCFSSCFFKPRLFWIPSLLWLVSSHMPEPAQLKTATESEPNEVLGKNCASVVHGDVVWYQKYWRGCSGAVFSVGETSFITCTALTPTDTRWAYFSLHVANSALFLSHVTLLFLLLQPSWRLLSLPRSTLP